MFDRLVRCSEVAVDDLDAAQTLDRAADARRVADAADVVVLRAAQHWADLHGEVDASVGSLPGSARLVRLGGDGCPGVDESCLPEFAAELAMSPGAGESLVADALALRHRLPKTWQAVRDGGLPVWVARRVAQLSRPLAREACGRVDATAAFYGPRLTPGRLFSAVEAAVIAADPDAADDRAEAVRDQHGVWLSPSTEAGTKTLFARGEAADLIRLDAAVGHTADALAALGSPDPDGIRRARALGLLASPQQALDLHAHAAAVPHEQWPTGTPQEPAEPDRVEGSVEARAQRAAATDPSTREVKQPRHKPDPRPKATLYVHLSADTIADLATGRAPAHPVARVEGIGPATLAQARRWLADAAVTVKPVIDLNNMTPADSYETPPRLREAVALIHPCEPWPHSATGTRGSSGTGRTLDIDHTNPYQPPDHGGPPKQTAIGNLAPLTRKRHRAKTHGRWQLKQPYPGVAIWKSPHGRLYLVDPTGTRRLN